MDGVSLIERLYARADKSPEPGDAILMFVIKLMVAIIETTIELAPTIAGLSAIGFYLALSDPAIRYYQRKRHARVLAVSPPKATNLTGRIVTFIFAACFFSLGWVYLFHRQEFEGTVRYQFQWQAVQRTWRGSSRYHHWAMPNDFPRFECMAKHSIGCEVGFLFNQNTSFEFWCKPTFSCLDGILTVVRSGRILPLYLTINVLERLGPVLSPFFHAIPPLIISVTLATILETALYLVSQSPEDQPTVIQWLRNDNKTMRARN